MSKKIINRARMSITGTPGTGDVSLNTATSGYQTFANAGLADGDTFPYVIDDGGNWEIGLGTYHSAGPSFTRTTVRASSGGGTSLITASSSAVVYSSIMGEDVVSVNTLAALTGDVNISSPTDAQVLTYDIATSKWKNAASAGGGGGSGLTPPNPANFTDVQSLNGTTPVYQTTGGVPACVITSGSVGDTIMVGMFEAVPGGSWSAIAKMKSAYWGAISPNWQSAGIGIINNSGHKGMALARNLTGYQYVFGYTTTEYTGGAVVQGNYGAAQQDDFLHIDYDGTNLNFSLSIDGINKATFYSVAAASSSLGAAPTHVGLMCGGGFTTAAGPYFTFLHYHIGALGTNGL